MQLIIRTIKKYNIFNNQGIIFRIFLSLILFLSFICLSAQTRINSPYSIYGIGHISSRSNNVRSMSMGGIAYALSNPGFVNVANPASYTAFDSISFVFNGGIFGAMVTLKSVNLSQKTDYASINYLTFGFPVTKWWRSSFGLLPFSDVGYNISNEVEIENVGLVRYLNQGLGGLNQVYWGNAFKINDNLSVGINAAYLFGTIDKQLSTTFPDSVEMINTRIYNSITADDFYFTYGLQYRKELKNKLMLGAGVVFSSLTKIKAQKKHLATTYFGSNLANIAFFRDTIEYNPSIRGDIIIPGYIGFGLVLQKSDKWLIGADYTWQNWKKYSAFGSEDSLNNSMNISVGGQFTPNKYSILSYWERVSYRIGFRYYSSYLELHNKRIDGFGINFGLGFPLRKSRSTINLGFEIGQFGTTDNKLLQENIIRFTLGISIYERWFVKSKYK